MEEEMEKCKIFGKFESMTLKRSSEILADEKKIFGVKVRRKSVISEIFLESLNPPSQIPASATGFVRNQPEWRGVVFAQFFFIFSS